jgi:hypothetical protein
MPKKKWSTIEQVDEKFAQECYLCQQKFQFGNHIYDGRWVALWSITVCRTCLKGNWDGIVPGHHPHLEQHLVSSNIGYTLNSKGWIDIPN